MKIVQPGKKTSTEDMPREIKIHDACVNSSASLCMSAAVEGNSLEYFISGTCTLFECFLFMTFIPLLHLYVSYFTNVLFGTQDKKNF